MVAVDHDLLIPPRLKLRHPVGDLLHRQQFRAGNGSDSMLLGGPAVEQQTFGVRPLLQQGLGGSHIDLKRDFRHQRHLSRTFVWAFGQGKNKKAAGEDRLSGCSVTNDHRPIETTRLPSRRQPPR